MIFSFDHMTDENQELEEERIRGSKIFLVVIQDTWNHRLSAIPSATGAIATSHPARRQHF